MRTWIPDLAWLSPVVGGTAPALSLLIRKGVADIATLTGTCTVWALRDLLIGYTAVLPILWICRRLGMRHAILFWIVASAIGGPMGYVMANPVEFAWTPSEVEFQHGPYWDSMIIYMALFGLTGLVYSLFARLRKETSGT